MSNAAFGQLAKPIQRILWDLRWSQLRPIQVEAIRRVLEDDSDLIIAAATAGGKTEAAFLPILSRIHDAPGDSVRALYVGPLKALINDQFQRLETLCEHAGIPVHRWHGDVGEGAKRRLVERPGGVLLITPESIESLLINRSGHLPRLFAELEFVVIDEIHAFLGTERGTHLRSLLCRLEGYSRPTPRIVGLSATLGDLTQTARWFGPGRAERVRVITDKGEQKSVRYRIEAALEPLDKEEDKEEDAEEEAPRGTRDPTRDEAPPDDPDGERATGVTAAHVLARQMVEHFVGSTNLIFANARMDVELFADLLNAEARARGLPAAFLVHHGALSKEYRQQAEAEMQSARPATCLCSATLELGIDVGNVRAVGQIGPPWSVASLVQRLGRSGRREGEPAIMRMYLRERQPEPEAALPDHLHPDLLRAVALTELMLAKWVEPADPLPFDLSTLLQQVLSVITETGGATAAEVHRRLVTDGGFPHIEAATFTDLLRAMGHRDLIEQASDGTLILGLEGERLVRRYDFYSAFATPEMYQVRWQSRRLGEVSVHNLPRTNDHLLFAGRRWQVREVDQDSKSILVKPARGAKPPRFPGEPGEIHPRVREAMRTVLLGEDTYSYLGSEATRLLEQARAAGRRAELHRREIVPAGPGHCYWFTWTGTRIQRTLATMCERAGLDVKDCDICLVVEHSPDVLMDAVRNLAARDHDALQLAESLQQPRHRKYDEYLSHALLLRSAAENLLDVDGAMAKLAATAGRVHA